MALSMSDVINVQIVLTPMAVGRRDFGVMLAIGTSDVISLEERVRLYDSLDSVAEDFGVEAPEYLAAQAYYSQSPKPKSLMIGRWNNKAEEPDKVGIIGGKVGGLDTIKLNGGFKLPYTAPATIATYSTTTARGKAKASRVAVYAKGDPTESTLDVTVDLTGATDFENAATLLTAALKTPDTPKVPEVPEKVTYSAATCTNEIKGGSQVSCAPLNSDTQSYILLKDGTKVFAKSGGAASQGDATFICTQLNAKFDGYTFAIVENKCKITANSKIEDTKNIVCFVGMNIASTQDVYREVFGLPEYSSIQNWKEDNWKTIFTDIPQEVTPSVPETPVIPGKQIATAAYNAEDGNFELTGADGITALGLATAPDSGTDLSGPLGLSTEARAKFPGADAETALEAMTACRDASGDWYTGMFCVPITDDDVISIAGFIQGSGTPSMFGHTITDKAVLESTNKNDVASRMLSMDYTRTVLQYSQNINAIASFFGRMSTVNFTGNNTMITMKFKTEPGIEAEDLSKSQASTLDKKRVNYYVAYNNGTYILQQGVCSGKAWVDEIFGLDSLQNALQTEIWNLLYTSSTKVPQTDEGNGRIAAVISNVLDTYATNGLIAPGQWNADGFGQLASGDYLPDGYYIYYPPVADQLQSDREARKSVTFQVAVKLAGAIHSVDVIVNVNR